MPQRCTYGIHFILALSIKNMKLPFYYFFFITLLVSCNFKKEAPPVSEKIKFTSLTISYYSGFERHFNVIVDSNKIFFSPQELKIQYGILPDSIFKLVDSSVAAILSDRVIISKKISCEDCPIIGITLIANSDTFRISQQEEQIEPVFRKMCTPLYFFLHRQYPQIPNIYSFRETIKMIRELPPPFPG